MEGETGICFLIDIFMYSTMPGSSKDKRSL
jgi:hypothetical protein